MKIENGVGGSVGGPSVGRTFFPHWSKDQCETDILYTPYHKNVKMKLIYVSCEKRVKRIHKAVWFAELC